VARCETRPALPEIRLAVGEPGLDIGNVETALENLVRRCYYLDAKGTTYWISHRPTLNKVLADRRAALSGPEADEAIREKVRQAIREVFKAGPCSGPPVLPRNIWGYSGYAFLDHWCSCTGSRLGKCTSREAAQRLITDMIQAVWRTWEERSKAGFSLPLAEGSAALADEAKTLLALESLEDPTEQERLKLEPPQVEELRDKKRRS
jgi:hypothetical protein